MPNNPLGSVEEVKSLAERLSEVSRIAALSDREHNEPWVLADALSDIADASRAYLDALPSILDPELRGDDLMHALITVTLELQHMLYHLEDSRYLREFFAPLKADWDKERG